MTMEEITGAIDDAARILRNVKRDGRRAEFTLSNGIVLGVRAVPPLLLEAVMTEAMKEPDPPVQFIEEKQREEPNPSDPAYQAELTRLRRHAILVNRDVVLATGLFIKSLPDGYFMPDDERWQKANRVSYAVSRVGLEIVSVNDPDLNKRFLQWLEFYAFEDVTDALIAQQLVRELSGLDEGEVAEALASFQRNEEWNSDRGISDPIELHNGNRVQRRAAGKRAKH